MEEEVKSTLPDPPRGIYPARVDDKGRLKLPVNFERFLSGQPLFVTTWDGRMARIYPLPVWQENERLLDQENEDPEAAEDLGFLANKYGADADVDSQGRVLMPTDLRRDLGLEGQPVFIDYSNGAVNVYNKAIYEERKHEAAQIAADEVGKLEAAGLN